MSDKIMILKLLEEGKISGDEAVRLMEAIEGNNSKQKENDEKDQASGGPTGSAGYTYTSSGPKDYNQAEEDFAKRVETTAKDIVGATIKFTEKMFGQISSGINNIESKFTFVDKRAYTLDDIEGGYDLTVHTDGLGISIIPCFNNNIVMDIECKSLQKTVDVEKCISFNKVGKQYELILNFPESTWGKVDIQLPRNINELVVHTQNSKCVINDIIGKSIDATTSNAKIEINHCQTIGAKLNTDNSKIVITDCKVNNVIAKTNNARIEIIDSAIDFIDATTCNAPIYLSDIAMLTIKEGRYVLNTSNSKIDVMIRYNAICAYAVDAATSNGKLNVRLSDIAYNNDNTSDQGPRVMAADDDYNEAECRLRIEAKTYNSPINIVQG